MGTLQPALTTVRGSHSPFRLVAPVFRCLFSYPRWGSRADFNMVPPTYAAGSNMPWEAPLQSISGFHPGSCRAIFAVSSSSITGLTLAFGDTSGGFRRLIQIVFGLSIAFAATSFFLTFFAFCRRSARRMSDAQRQVSSSTASLPH